MYTLIDGSPKKQQSNSKYFLEYISKHLDEYHIYNINNNYKLILDNIKQSDTIVLAHPLYVDSPNYSTLSLLEYLYNNKDRVANKNFYVIINCGFREGEHNLTALSIIKNWCTKSNVNYMGSLLIGAGEIVGKPKYKLICKKALNNLKLFSNCIKNKELSKDIITTMDLLNNKIYCKLANKSWNKKIKRNKK